MKSMNDVLMKFFKLPPAVMMLLALLGFGSLATLLFRLVPGIRSPQGMKWILIIAGVGIAIFAVVWLFRKIRSGRQANKLADALNAQTGPTVGDIAEQQRIYRDRFRAKLAELRSNGLSVYKLPWFVLIGEPGCGKTASLIHSGIDFPLGRDEVPGFGGTRNYNWWFTNDAVILDTAGRLSFQEEGTSDKTEWEYFLKLIRNNRPRCPINGVIIAVPADKLITDTSEERAQKATILRERLRQLSQALGVRFPTTLLVTKMDKVGGFAEFFEDMRVELSARRQMFGWSRPGEFQDPYDPGTFRSAFEQVHGRLRDWGMRYLQRNATDQELGLIVTFPEAFRDLREPLNDYVTTIFQKSPLVEPPFFRGFYFSSATQEGAPLFNVFQKMHHGVPMRERPTPKVASMSFFIYDFYVRKVFPEHGLVFRSAKHATLNKRMRTWVFGGSTALAALMLTFFVVGWVNSRNLIDKPKEVSLAATTQIGKVHDGTEAISVKSLSTPLKTADDLWGEYTKYTASSAWVFAKMLYIGADTSLPRDSVREIHARYVLECVARPVLLAAAQKLASDAPPISNKDERDKYMAALAALSKWYGEAVGTAARPALKAEESKLRKSEFAALAAIVGDIPPAEQTLAADHFGRAVESLGGSSRAERSFARDVLLSDKGMRLSRDEATAALVAAVGKLGDRWKPVTSLSAEGGTEIRYWDEFGTRISLLRGRFESMLALTTKLADPAQFRKAAAEFAELGKGSEYLGDPKYPAEAGSLHEAMNQLMKFLSERGADVPQDEKAKKVMRFAEIGDRLKGRWNDDFKRVEDALLLGETTADRSAQPRAAVFTAITAARDTLDKSLAQSLSEVRRKLVPDTEEYKSVEPVDYYRSTGLIEVVESTETQAIEGKARLQLARNPFGADDVVKSHLVELSKRSGLVAEEIPGLDDLAKWPELIKSSDVAEPAGSTPLDVWLRSAPKERGSAADVKIADSSNFKDRPFWQPVKFFQLASALTDAQRKSRTELLLGQMKDRAEKSLVADENAREDFLTLVGMGRLMKESLEPAEKLPFEWHRFNRGVARAPEAPRAVEQPTNEPADPRSRSRERDREQPVTPTPTRGPAARESARMLRNYHTRESLRDTLRAVETVLAALKESKQPNAADVAKSISDAADAYILAYLRDWYMLYDSPARLLDERTLELIELASKSDLAEDQRLTWPKYVDRLKGDAADIGGSMRNRLDALVTNVFTLIDSLDARTVPIDAAVRKRLGTQLDAAQQKNISLETRLADAANQQNWPRSGEPGRALAEPIAAAWSNYVKEVQSLGALVDDRAAGAASIPDLKKLRDDALYKTATKADNNLIRPMLEIAGYGEQLLANHLETRLHETVFKAANDKYPVVDQAKATCESMDFSELERVTTLKPDELIDLLKRYQEFSDRYGRVFAASTSDGRRLDENVRATFDRCSGWIKFLYKDPADLKDKRPRAVTLKLAFIPADGAGSPGAVYKAVRLSLPVTPAAGGVALDKEFTREIFPRTPRAALAEEKEEFEWDLFGPATGGSTAAFSQLVSGANPVPDPAEIFKLSGSPWTLIMLLTSSPSNQKEDGIWAVPLKRQFPVESIKVIGFQLCVQFLWTDRTAAATDRAFPGLIPPFRGPKSQPTFSNADFYLKLR